MVYNLDGIGDVLYGIGSDFDEDDLYLLQSDVGDADHQIMDSCVDMEREKRNKARDDRIDNDVHDGREHRENRRRRAQRETAENHGIHDLNGINGLRLRGRGEGGPWRRGVHHGMHHDLDYVPNAHDAEIIADSCNLDNDEMARWNTGH